MGGHPEVFNAYGITETGSWVAGTSVGEFEPEDGLVGVPWGAVIKILKSAEPHAPFDPTLPMSSRRDGLYLDQHAGVDARLLPPAGVDRSGDFGRMVLHRRHRPRSMTGAGFISKGREREEINKGGHEDLSGGHRCGGRTIRAGQEVCAFAIADPLYGQNIAMAVVLKDENGDDPRAP